MTPELFNQIPKNYSEDYVYFNTIGVSPDQFGTIIEAVEMFQPDIKETPLPDTVKSNCDVFCHLLSIIYKHNFDFEIKENAHLTTNLNFSAKYPVLADISIVRQIAYRNEELASLIIMASISLDSQGADWSSDIEAWIHWKEEELFDYPESEEEIAKLDDYEREHYETLVNQLTALEDLKPWVDKANNYWNEIKKDSWTQVFFEKITLFKPKNKQDYLWKRWLFNTVKWLPSRLLTYNNAVKDNYYDEGLTWVEWDRFFWGGECLQELFFTNFDEYVNNHGIQEEIYLDVTGDPHHIDEIKAVIKAIKIRSQLITDFIKLVEIENA